MRTLQILIKRNIKLFFKDKGMFFTSLITPIILLVLYATFLGNIYKDSFIMSLPQGFSLPDSLLNGMVGGQLVSSILAVSCVTVAFCSNFLMVQDKANGNIRDLKMSPIKMTTLSLSYYMASFLSTFIICLTAGAVCLIYLRIVGWYLAFNDILFLLLDIFLLVLFGTALSSVVNFFLSTQGQISAVGAVVSATYGFVCGAYMPISQFSEGLQKVLLFLPGTYATSLLRNHTLRGAFEEIGTLHIPDEVIQNMKDSIDCNLYWGTESVNLSMMYGIVGGAVLVLIAAYILMNILKKRHRT